MAVFFWQFSLSMERKNTSICSAYSILVSVCCTHTNAVPQIRMYVAGSGAESSVTHISFRTIQLLSSFRFTFEVQRISIKSTRIHTQTQLLTILFPFSLSLFLSASGFSCHPPHRVHNKIIYIDIQCNENNFRRNFRLNYTIAYVQNQLNNRKIHIEREREREHKRMPNTINTHTHTT